MMERSDKTQIRFFTESNNPRRPILYRCAIFLGIYAIVTVLKIALSRELNTQRDYEEENSGSGKSKIFHGIPGYGEFFHGKSGSNTPSGGPLFLPSSPFFPLGDYNTEYRPLFIQIIVIPSKKIGKYTPLS